MLKLNLIFKVIAVGAIATIVISCSGSSDSGTELGDAEERKKKYTKQDYALVYSLNARDFNGNVVRWPSKTIGVSHNHPIIVSAGRRWKEMGLVFNGSRQINFVGYSREAPGACAWAIPYGYNTGQLLQCDIYLHPENIDSPGCVNAELVISHEIGHCLGVWGHTVGGMMAPTANGSPDNAVPAHMLNVLYTIPLPTNIRPNGDFQAASVPRSFDVIQHPTLYTYPEDLKDLASPGSDDL